ncbi:hypothetical protein VP01_1077g6 [Puccinia sorghi]|uniref:Uncharacterized protein n=1 Tax=Puccinia sorghi TaxID=27349 RepID=A0A0L6VTH1_9BASI|nr:hypothetical protein VP01_1077g6 [Puccinia sorghi]
MIISYGRTLLTCPWLFFCHNSTWLQHKQRHCRQNPWLVCQGLPIPGTSQHWTGNPQVVGVMNGTHIPVATPADDDWKGYINRISWASIVFQCVVDAEDFF